MSESLEARLRRLQDERDEADRRYNDALTGVDRALPRRPELPDPRLPLDEHQLGTLNHSWNTLPEPPVFGSGVRGRLGRFVWGIIGPYLQRQLTFNSQLVDHLNRQAEAMKAAHAREVELAQAARWYQEATTIFHTHLLLYLQQVTGYVDTRDRLAESSAHVLNAAISSVAEIQAKYAESLNARERRYEVRVNALQSALAELRTVVGIVQQAVTAVRQREASLKPAPSPQAPSSGSPSRSATTFLPDDAHKYVGFENEFRGSEGEIRSRQQSYVEYFKGAQAPVLDVGCGRGEFIELLASHRIAARGIDINTSMVQLCRERGLDVVESDAVSYLTSLPDESLGGLFAAQVVEHLEPAYLLRFLELTLQKMLPGGSLVLETLNPACWTAFFESYIRDVTHRWPLHPDTLRYFVLASGFTSVAVEFRSPIPSEAKLQSAVVRADAEADLREFVNVHNGNVEKLNARMFTHLDYAVIARKPARP